MSTARAKTIVVNSFDAELSVTYYENKDKPTLLFLHGFPDCQQTWDHQVKGLQKDYAIITFDMRGVAHSTWSGRKNGFHMSFLLEDIERVIDATVGNTAKVHLIGHDWGSVIGWSFISEPNYSKRVLSYTSVSGPHLGLMLDWIKRSLLSKSANRIGSAFRQAALSWYVYLFNIPVLPELLFKTIGKPVWKTALTLNGVNKADEYLHKTKKQISEICINSINLYRQNPLSPPAVPTKNSIDVPVQLIIPNQDRFVSENLFEHYEEYVVDLTKKTIAGKHWVHHSHSFMINSLISNFIQTKP